MKLCNQVFDIDKEMVIDLRNNLKEFITENLLRNMVIHNIAMEYGVEGFIKYLKVEMSINGSRDKIEIDIDGYDKWYKKKGGCK